MPGCTIRQRWRDKISFGMAIFSIGARIKSGASWETSAIIASFVAAMQTRISWPRALSSIHRRWLRLLWADVKNRIRMGFLLIFFVRQNEPEPVFMRAEAEGAAKGEAQNHFPAPPVQGSLRRAFCWVLAMKMDAGSHLHVR